MNVVSYKCPCCSAPLKYAGGSGKLECAACGNSFDPETLDALQQEDESSSSVSFSVGGGAYSDADAGQLHTYTCPYCGAELMTDGNTTATECAYCGSPAILPSQLADGTRPACVLPFKVSEEEAKAKFRSYFQNKKLIPDIFVSTKNRIAEIRRLYVPYYLFSCEANARVSYNAQQIDVHRSGDWETTRTRYFLVRRSGKLRFENIPVDGSVKLDDRITESLEPYDFSEMVDFAPAKLAGALADKADADVDACRDRAVERLEVSTAEVFRETVRGYDAVEPRHTSIRVDQGTATPVLLPVWLITTEKSEKGQKKTYTFAINGQTGKLTCDVPYSKTKARKWFWSLTAAITVGGYILLLVLAMLGVI